MGPRRFSPLNMSTPAYPRPRFRRGSAATIFFRIVLFIGIAFGGYVAWQKIQRDRLLAEASPAPAATASAEDDRAKLPEPEAVKETKRGPEVVDTPAPAAPAKPDRPYVLEEFAEPVSVGLADLSEGRELLKLLEREKYQFTPAVKAGWFSYARARANAELKAMKKELPADFRSWVDGNRAVAATVYGAKADSAKVLLMLRSLELDLGRDAVRSKYTDLALAAAIVAVSDGVEADITPRDPLKLVIGGDPRKPVNTKDPKRTLDMNDHIINFLEDHEPISGDIVGGMAQALPELVYDSKGVALSLNDKKKTPSPTVKRELIAADVLASRKLQEEFNAYMKSKGFPTDIDCGDRVIFPGQTAAIHGEKEKRIYEAYRLFRTAYEEKGRLALRDKPATFAERCAYLIRNDTTLPATYGPKKTKVPRFPLTAPWPMLTFIAALDEPLREREDLLQRLRKNGEFHTYGEYIGDIAQQGEMQRARRLAPYAFGYQTESTRARIGRDPMAMMIKDGGVCGTMAAMGVFTYEMLGIPASTAGQPGHCALIYARRDEKTRRYEYDGGQYVTAGHENTHPHIPWYFNDIDRPKPMIWHQASAFAVNYGMPAFLDSMAAWQLYKALPEETRKAQGDRLLASAATINPFNLAVAEAALTSTESAPTQLRIWNEIKTAVISSSARAGSVTVDKKTGATAAGGLYLTVLEGLMADHLAKLTPPADKTQATLMADLIKKRADQVALEAAAAKKNG